MNYTAETGTALPHSILWTPVSYGSSNYLYEMLFNYGTNVPHSYSTEVTPDAPAEADVGRMLAE